MVKEPEEARTKIPWTVQSIRQYMLGGQIPAMPAA